MNSTENFTKLLVYWKISLNLVCKQSIPCFSITIESKNRYLGVNKKKLLIRNRKQYEKSRPKSRRSKHRDRGSTTDEDNSDAKTNNETTSKSRSSSKSRSGNGKAKRRDNNSKSKNDEKCANEKYDEDSEISSSEESNSDYKRYIIFF